MDPAGNEVAKQAAKTEPQPKTRSACDGVRSHESRRVPELDGIRGLALFIVLLMHCSHTMPLNLKQPRIDFVYKILIGAGSVDLFFVLSGFLITGILLDAKGFPRFFSNFYARRILRIFPLYYGFLFMTLVIMPAFGARVPGLEPWQEKWYWMFMPNFSTAWRGLQPGYNFVALWSLGVEEQFYLAWPMLVWLFPRSKLRLILLCAVVGAPVARYCLYQDTVAARLSLYVLPHARMDSLGMGALVAVLQRDQGGLERFRRWARALMAACGIWLIGLAMTRAQYVQMQWNRFQSVANFSVLAVFYACMIIMTLTSRQGSGWRRFFCSWLMRTWGKYSYAMYIFQLPMFAMAQKFGLTPEQLPSAWGSWIPSTALFSACMTIAVTFAAWLSWNLYEKHFMALKRYFAN